MISLGFPIVIYKGKPKEIMILVNFSIFGHGFLETQKELGKTLEILGPHKPKLVQCQIL